MILMINNYDSSACNTSINPASFVGHIDICEGRSVINSPKGFIKVKGNVMEMRVIRGTIG